MKKNSAFEKKTTEELLQILKNIDSRKQLQDYIDLVDSAENKVQTFSQYMHSLPEFQNARISDIIRDSKIERTYGYQIFNGTRTPGHDKVVMVGLALHLSFEQVQKALKSANTTLLYSRDRRDAILIFGIEHCMTVPEVNELLIQFGEEILY